MFGTKKNKARQGSPDVPDTGQDIDHMADPEQDDPRAGMADAAQPGAGYDVPEWDDPPAGPGSSQADPGEPEDPDAEPRDETEDALAEMAGAGNRPGRPKKKPKAGRKRQRDDGDGSGPGGLPGRWAAMSEARRQAVFTMGCAAAGFCAVLLVISGTVFACRMFRAKPNEILAQPSTGDIYYDQAGKMHVNVHITREPDTEITVYVMPDGSVTTEKPDGDLDAANVKTMVLYVDAEGNISDKPPQQSEPSDPEPAPDTVTLYLTEAGELVESRPESGAYQPVEVKLDGNGGVAGVTKGGIEGTPSVPENNGGQAQIRNPLAPVALYIGIDGKLTTQDPGDGAEKFVMDFGDGTGDPTVSQAPDADVPQDPAQPEQKPADDDHTGGQAAGTEPGKNPYDGMTEAEILAEAERRRKEGNGWYLDGDEVYIVKRGDTLSYLSGKLGFSVDFLASYNQIRDKNLIITGEALRYPAARN